MAVVDLDPGLTAAGPTAIEAALADTLGAPLLVRFDADALAAADVRALRAWLRNVPFATMAIGEPAPDLRDVLDFFESDPAAADRITAGFERAPLAGVTAALLTRVPPAGVWPGLVAESTAYSMLQGGPEFAAWRAAHPVSPAADADEPRVRVDARARSRRRDLDARGASQRARRRVARSTRRRARVPRAQHRAGHREGRRAVVLFWR